LGITLLRFIVLESNTNLKMTFERFILEKKLIFCNDRFKGIFGFKNDFQNTCSGNVFYILECLF